jgi:hypothetical protein
MERLVRAMNLCRHSRWLLCSAALMSLLPLGGCYNQADDFRRLAASPSAAQGHVVYVDCNSHGLVVYSFSSGTHEYRRKTDALRCGDSHVGDPVTVFYDSADPNTSTLRDPSEAYERARGWYLPEWAMPVLVAVMVVLGIVFQAVSAKRKSRSDAKSTH